MELKRLPGTSRRKPSRPFHKDGIGAHNNGGILLP